MNKLISNVAVGLAALCALGCGGRALAATYDFTYTFLDGGSSGGPPGSVAGEVTGRFTATGPISDLTDISNITMSLNGTPMSGPFYAWSYNPPPNVNGFPGDFTPNTATVSSDPTQNDFLFTNAQTASDPPGNYFYIIQPWDNQGPGSTTIATQLVNNGVAIDVYNGQYVTSNWTLTAIPEPATWATMLVGVAMIGGGLRSGRRRILTTSPT